MQHEKTLKKVRNVTLVTAIVYLFLGITLIGFEEPFRAVIGYVIAAAAMALGIFRLVIYLRHRKEELMATDLFLFCILAGLAVLCAYYHENMMTYIMIIIGVLLFVGGLIKVQNAIDLKHFGFEGWWISLILGLVSILFAAVVIRKPEIPLIAVDSLLAGIFLIYDAAASFFTMILAHRVFARVRKGLSPNPERKMPPAETMEHQTVSDQKTDASAKTPQEAASFDDMQPANSDVFSAPSDTQQTPQDNASETVSSTPSAESHPEDAPEAENPMPGPTAPADDDVKDASCEPVAPSDPFDAPDTEKGDAKETENIGRDINEES